MKPTFQLFLFVFFLLALTPATSSFAQETKPAIDKLPEAFRERVNAATSHITCDWVLDVADSLEQYSNEKDDKQYFLVASLLRSYNAYCNSDSVEFLRNNSIVLELAEEFNFYDRYFTEGTNRVSFYLNNFDYYAAMKFSKFLTKKSKGKNHPMVLFSGYHSLGNIYEKLGMYKKALDSFAEAYRILENNDDSKYAMYHKFCRRNMAFDYYYLEQYSEAERLTKELIKEDPLDIRAIGVLAATYFKTGRYKEFRECKNIVDTINVESLGNLANSYKYIKTNVDVLALALDGKTDEAIKLAETRPFLESQNRKIDVYMFANRWKEAYESQKVLYAHYDSLSVTESDCNMDELNLELEKIYQVNEKQGQIDRLMYHVTIGFLVTLVIVILCLYFVRRNYIVTKSNKKLAETLDQMIEYKKMVMENVESKMEQIKSDEKSDETSKDSSSAVVTEDKASAKTTYDDVTRYIYEIATRKLFTNPDFDKNSLLAELNIHRSNFFSDFERQNGCSVTKFVLRLRMEYAAVLIKDNPEYTLEAIAAECGISSRTTFYRNFTNHFGITPSAYRLEHLGEE